MKSPRILIAEDDPDTLDLISRALGKHGYDLDLAVNGKEALQRAARQTPDLVVSDVMMPEMDGWTFVRCLRARQETAFTPVIFLTALDAQEDLIQGFRLGADDYMPKQFSPKELDLRVHNLLQRVGRIREQTRQAMAAAIDVQGSLERMGVSSLLLLMELEKKSGVLILHHLKEVASLYMVEGRIVRAHTAGLPALRGAECVYYVMKWSTGRFSLSPLEAPVPDEIKLPTTQLLLESARRMDEGRKKN